MPELEFPISDYYKNNILDGITISRDNVWWTAVLVINDPRTKIPFISLYRWQQTGNVWKVRGRFHFRNKQQILDAFDIIQDLIKKSDLF
jgi:hypothetical protein